MTKRRFNKKLGEEVYRKNNVSQRQEKRWDIEKRSRCNVEIVGVCHDSKSLRIHQLRGLIQFELFEISFGSLNFSSRSLQFWNVKDICILIYLLEV